MNYTFDFSSIAQYLPILLKGIAVTIQLIAVGAVLGVALGVACAWARTQGPAWLKPIVATYVELIRNTPFLIQLFFIFFGLPSIGVHLSEMTAATLAMVINLGAYSCEIVRAGLQATPKGQWEAGVSLAMTRFEVFRYVVLVPALRRIWPALSSQIAAEDLTFAANFIQSRNFRPFEIYFVTTAIYLCLAILLRQFLNGIGWWLFPRRVTR